jgi:hypothetical protein
VLEELVAVVAHDQHEQPGIVAETSRRRASSSSICRMPAS